MKLKTIFENTVKPFTDESFAKQTLRDEETAIVDYTFRLTKIKDKELKNILKHLLKEEKEHAKMVKEWLKRYNS